MTSWYNAINQNIAFMQSWYKLMNKSADIMQFSPQVIDLRTKLFSNPKTQYDWWEFYEMYYEKYTAMMSGMFVWNNFLLSSKNHNPFGMVQAMNEIAKPYATKTKANTKRLQHKI